VAGLRILLKTGGRIILEFPYAADLIEHTEFDTIYHEHVFYFTLTALEPLFQATWTFDFPRERLAIHGGSLRLFVSQSGTHPVRASVADLVAEEKRKANPLASVLCWLRHSGLGAQERVRRPAAAAQNRWHRIAAYGASPKAALCSTIMAWGVKPSIYCGPQRV